MELKEIPKPEDWEIVSKKDELFKALKKLKEISLKELDFLKSDTLDEKKIEEFSDKKNKLRKLIDYHLNSGELLQEEKEKIVSILNEILSLEERIGQCYKEKLYSIQDGLIHINTERKLRETYGRGGMSFLMDDDKNLK